MTFTKNDTTSFNGYSSGQNKLAAMQPYFFPYIGYFQLIDEVDIFVLYDKVSYRKSTWLNRNRIKDKGTSQPLYLTVPVQHVSSNMLIEKVRITKNDDWKTQFKNLIYYNYKRALFFDEVFEFIVELIFNDEKSLHKYNGNILLNISKKLGIMTSIIIENEAHEQVEANLRNMDIPNELRKQHRVIQLCKLYDSKDYINPINGMSLYDFDFFERHNTQLHFMEAERIEYPQFNEPFWENMSIIDVLMHNGFDGTRKLLQHRKLIHHGTD